MPKQGSGLCYGRGYVRVGVMLGSGLGLGRVGLGSWLG